jgi:hypothetical protein
MKNLLMLMILVFAMCVLSSPATAQTRAKAKVWTYNFDGSGDPTSSVERMNIVITQVRNGYAVSGSYVTGPWPHHICRFSGSYYTATGRLRALSKSCGNEEIDGRMRKGGNEIDITLWHLGLGLVATRVGAKRVPSTSQETTTVNADIINVDSATYGANCPGVQDGNATRLVSDACNGSKNTCNYTIGVRTDADGDPAYGCRKNFVVRWHCGNNGAAKQAQVGGDKEAGYGMIITLSCP